ncbi:MAG: nucleotidyltransferase substrate binding protein [Thermotogota bacterium]|nr:nucleotidyltransferase substrate binding protein [Thermotogota bacterium]
MSIIKKDIRWIQRYSNFKKALSNLHEAVELSGERELTKLEKQGLIQSFEYTYELAWNTIRDFYRSKGEVEIQGSRDAFRLAFERSLIQDGQVFMNMIKSRQLSSHTYIEETADDIYQDIVNHYFSAFQKLAERLQQEKQKEVE